LEDTFIFFSARVGTDTRMENGDLLCLIADALHADDVFWFGSTCRLFYMVVRRAGRWPCRTTRTSLAASVGRAFWVRDHDPEEWEHLQYKLCSLAARSGNVRNMRLFHKMGLPCQVDAAIEAASAGNHLELIYCVDSDLVATRGPSICAAAVRGGNLGLLQFLRSENVDWDCETTAAASLVRGQLGRRILRYCLDHGCPHDYRVAIHACSIPDLEMVQIARSYGCEWTNSAGITAASAGALDILLWAREHGDIWKLNNILEAAALDGHKDIILYLANEVGYGPHYDVRNVATLAAGRGNIEVLNIVRQRNWNWPAEVSGAASMGQHFDAILWMHQHGLHWSPQLLASSKCEAIRDFAVSHVPPPLVPIPEPDWEGW